jgi:tetratricopeptide (TPR) repeat protein
MDALHFLCYISRQKEPSMKTRIIYLMTLILGFSFLLLSQEQKATGLIGQGDELYARRGDLAKAKEALTKYREALAAGEDKYECYWRMARVAYWIGDRTGDNDEKKKIFNQGIEDAKKAVELEPKRVEGHFWLGVNYGSYGEAKGILKSLSLVGPIKFEMVTVLRIDPRYENGGANRVLGRVYYKLPGFAGGSNKKSLLNLLKSKELGPQDGLTRIYLAETYLAMDEVEKARAELEFVLNMTADPNDAGQVAELPGQKEQARKLLEKKDFHKK